MPHVYAVPGDTYVVLPDEGADLPEDEAQALLARGLVTLTPPDGSPEPPPVPAEPEPTSEPAPAEPDSTPEGSDPQ